MKLLGFYEQGGGGARTYKLNMEFWGLCRHLLASPYGHWGWVLFPIQQSTILLISPKVLISPNLPKSPLYPPNPPLPPEGG